MVSDQLCDYLGSLKFIVAIYTPNPSLGTCCAGNNGTYD